MEKRMVLKRSGAREPLDIQQIQQYTSKAVAGLAGVSQSELEVDANLQFFDGITSSQIQMTLTKTAVDKIDIDRPNWTFVAARLQLFDIYHQVAAMDGYPKLQSYFSEAIEAGRMIIGLKEKYDLEFLDSFIKPERDYEFNYLGIKTLIDRYLLKDSTGAVIELPQHMFMAVSMFLASLETFISDKNKEKFLSTLNDEQKEVFLSMPMELMARTFYTIKFYNMISKFEVMMATPTLSNCRTPRHQLSSCYVGSTPDDIDGIFDAYKDQALLSKFGGGIGWDWTDVRAQGSFIDKHKKAAGGTVPFLKIDNDIAIAVDQLGTRKGAIAVYLEPWHLDILDFMDLKKNSGEERRRAHDLFPALWLNDLFMERVVEDKDWTLFDPYDVSDLHTSYSEEFRELYEMYETYPIRKETIKAKDLWKKILTSYFETGTPFLCFKDSSNRANPNQHSGVIRSSNLCTEIFQNTSPDVYMTKIELENGEIIVAEETTPIEVGNGIFKNASKVTTIDSINGVGVAWVGKERVFGDIAVCNLASVNLSRVNKKEDIEEIIPFAVRALDNVIELNFYPVWQTKKTNQRRRPVGLGMMGEHEMLTKYKIMYGSDEHFEKIDEIMEIISYNAINASADIAAEKGSYPEFDGSNWSKGIMPFDHANEYVNSLVSRKLCYDWEPLREKVKLGMRNGYLMAIAPTSSISILVGTTQAIEPIFKRKWFEENLSGLIPVVAPGLTTETWELYQPAYDIDQTRLVKAAAIRQKWIDQGQSLNIFIKLEIASGKFLNDLYLLAWKVGLKSTYYLRSQSAEVKKDVADRSVECEGCQ